MRNNRLKNIETLYLLGAGASYAISLSPRGKELAKTTPLDGNFNSRILNHRSNKKWVKEAIAFHRGNWVGVDDIESLPLEESILKRAGNFDLLKAVHKPKLNGNSKVPAKVENDIYINNLSHVITEILCGCKQSRANLATLFAKGLFKKKQRTKNGKKSYFLPHRRIITFNYDTLLDKEILEHSSLDENELYFERIGSTMEEAERALGRKPKQSPFPFMLKLHGSANWRVTEEHYRQIVSGECDPSTRVPIWYDWSKVPSVSDHISPLIVPPLPNKPITTCSIFAHLWQCAFEYLHETKKLVIAGYSCPQTDSFAMSLLSNVRESKLEEIVIIDPAVEAIAKYKRLLRMAANSKTKWVYYDDFGEYLRATYG